jgi:hypothetical protein
VGLAKRSASPDRTRVKGEDRHSSDSDSESSEASLSSVESLEDDDEEDEMAVDTPQVVVAPVVVAKKKVDIVRPTSEVIGALRTLAADKNVGTIDTNGYIKAHVSGVQPHAILYSFMYTCTASANPKLGLPPTRNIGYSVYNHDAHAIYCSKMSDEFWITPFNDIKLRKIEFFDTETQFVCGIASLANRLGDFSGDNLVFPDCIQMATLSFHHRELNYVLNVMYKLKSSTKCLNQQFSVSTGQLADTIETQRNKHKKHLY